MTSVVAEHWNIFEPPVEDNSTVYFEYRDIREKNVNVSTLTKYEFVMNDLDAFVFMHRSYLWLKCQLQRDNAGGGDAFYAAGDRVTFQNGLPIFIDGELRINDKLIERVDFLDKVRLIRALLEYSDDYMRSSGSDQGFAIDTGTGGSAADGTTIVPYRATVSVDGDVATAAAFNAAAVVNANTLYNEGFHKRHKLSLGAGGALKTFYVRIPLSSLFKFAKDVRKVHTGARITLRFSRNTDAEIIYRNTGLTDGKFVLQDMIWRMPYLKPSLEVSLKLEEGLKDGAKIPLAWEAANCHRAQFNHPQSNLNWTITAATDKPSRVFVFFQNQANNNVMNRNGARFEHLTLTQATLKVGTFRFPETQYEATMGEDDYIQLYNALMQCTDKQTDVDSGCLISYENWKLNYPILAWDLRNSDEKLFTPGQALDITLECRLTSTANFFVYAVVFSEIAGTLDIINRKMLIELAH